MNYVKQASILVLAALILALGSHSQRTASAARQLEAPDVTTRFVVFEAFLNAG